MGPGIERREFNTAGAVSFPLFQKFVRRRNALFSKYGVSVRTHVHEGICIPLVVKHELSKHIFLLLQVEVVVHNCILHDLCMPATTIFPLKTVARFAALCLFVCVV